ncbi:MAG: TetR/AcrR family transcriptional regulator [Betaproteobacteria bacterium]
MKKDAVTAPRPRKPRGRPRSFDREAALDAAMKVFWSKGYEGASLAELTDAMGINPPSLYAAFGDKEGLFLEAAARYEAQLRDACPYADEPTARESVEKLLTDLVGVFTGTGHPRGCMLVLAAATASASPRLQAALAERRAGARARFKSRIEQGIREGELPADTDSGSLANFYVAVIIGMAMQARDGATRKGLLATVESAMRAWPEPPKASRSRRDALAA